MRQTILIPMLFVLGCSNPAPQPDAAPLVDDPAEVAASSEAQAPEPALRDAGSRTFASAPQRDGQGEILMLVELRPLDAEQATRRGFAVDGRTAEIEIRLLHTQESYDHLCGLSPYSACADCALRSIEKLPAELDCSLAKGTKSEVPRRVTLEQKADVIEVLLEGKPPFPTTITGYTVKPVSPFEIAFGALVKKTTGNSSSETAALGSLTEPLQKRADEVGAKAREVEAIVRDIGVDPMTLPVELAIRIREEVQEANVASLRHPPARPELLREAVHYELRDAGLAPTDPESAPPQ